MYNYTYPKSIENMTAIERLYVEDVSKTQQVILHHTIKSNTLLRDLDALKAILPKPTPSDSYTVSDQPTKKPTQPTYTPTTSHNNRQHAYQQPIFSSSRVQPEAAVFNKIFFNKDQYFIRSRTPRFASLLMGSIGTVFGLYNTHRMNQLSNDLAHVKDSINQMVEVIDDHEVRMQGLNSTLHGLVNYIYVSRAYNPIHLSHRCHQIEQEILESINRVIHAVQTAQFHRLAVDVLKADQIQRLFKKLKGVAKRLNNKLLVEKPSDLYQLEVSYVSDGQDIHLLLHVPTVPAEGLLDLYQLHPFPLPLNGNHSLIPVVENNVLALTSDYRKYHTQLSTTTLMGCQKVCSVYICERHGVLIKNLNQTCVGSLYLQDYEAAQRLCSIMVAPTQEIVFQLLGNWFLIFSPEVFTADVHCANSTRSRFFIPEGVSKHHLSPGCHSDFRKHVLFSNNAVRLESDILHFEWQWESKFFENNNPADLIDSLVDFQNSGNSAPTLNDLTHMKVKRKSGFNYLFHIIGFILSTFATAIVAVIIIFLIFRYRTQVMQSYDICCNICPPCTKSTKTNLAPVGNEHEDVPLQEINPLPRYATTYRPSQTLYPPSD